MWTGTHLSEKAAVLKIVPLRTQMHGHAVEFITVVHRGKERLQIDLHPHSFAHKTSSKGQDTEHFVSVGSVVCRFWCVQQLMPYSNKQCYYDECVFPEEKDHYWSVGPIEKAGIRVGDVLVNVDGEDVSRDSCAETITKVQKALKEKVQSSTDNNESVTLVFARHWQGLGPQAEAQLNTTGVRGISNLGHGFGMNGKPVHLMYSWNHWHGSTESEETQGGGLELRDNEAASAVTTANMLNSAVAAGEKMSGTLAPFVGEITICASGFMCVQSMHVVSCTNPLVLTHIGST